MDLIHDRPEQRPPQTEFALLQFETYEDYLDSLYTPLDRCYLQDEEMCRKVAEFGYKKDTQTFSREDFIKKRKKVLIYTTPIRPHMLASSGYKSGDPAQTALALREKANRVGIASTIIFINYTTSTGREISGYIDYGHSLYKKDWKRFFLRNIPVYPDRFDLGFYDWKKNHIVTNSSLYFKTLMSPKRGLMFQHKFDRMLITPDPFSTTAGQQTTRTRIKSRMYNSFILIDHISRSRK